ncbi:MAG: hypothetical protein J6O23_04675, partial [Prevotella sp.]|nr:hypothetical protein [Prevotella sp.]
LVDRVSFDSFRVVNIIKVYASFTFNDDTELHQYRIPMIMKGAQTQRLVQVIDIGIIPLAGNLLERNLASLIDRVYQP